MKKIIFYLIAVLLLLGCSDMPLFGIHGWTDFTEDNGKTVVFQQEQLQEKHVDPDFLEQLTKDVKAAVSAADLNSGFLNDKIIVEGLTKDIDSPGADEKLKIINAQKIKVRSDDGLAGFMDDKFLVDYTLQKQVVDATTNLKLQVGMCNFAGLSGTDYQSLNCLLGEDYSGVKRKISPEMLATLSSRTWQKEGISNSEYIPMNDVTDVTIDMSDLDPADADYNKNHHLTWGYGDNKARCLGRISTIGSSGVSYTEEDLVALHGSLLVISAEDYSAEFLSEQCWFSIVLDAVNLADAFGIKQRMTAYNLTTDFLINAVFQFDYPPGTNDPSLAKWVLIDWETLPVKLWQGDDYSDTPSGTPIIHKLKIPNTDRFPFDGYYTFNVYIQIDCDFTQTPLPPPPYAWNIFWNSIEVYVKDADGSRRCEATDAGSYTIARAGACIEDCYTTLGGTHHVYQLNVSGYFRLIETACTKSYLELWVYEPTGVTTFLINNVLWYVEYKAKKKAHYCNPPAGPP